MASTALCLGWGWALPALAQQADVEIEEEETETGEGFLGTITLGESKRAVQTQTASSVTVIDEEEIRDRQGGSVAELIDSVPGVSLVNGNTAQGSGIAIRGFGAKDSFGNDQKVVIQVDGATRGSEEMYRIGTQLFTDPFLYKEVEVIRGTVGSFEYGSGAVGGVVRLETIDPEDVTGGETGFALRQTLEFQSNGEGVTHSTIGAWQPTEDFGLMFNYIERNLGFPEDGDGNIINPDRDEIDDPSWFVKGKYRFGDDKAHSLEASYQNTKSSQFDVLFDSFDASFSFFGRVDRIIEAETAILKYAFNPVSDLVDLSLQYSYTNEEIEQEAVFNPFMTPLLDVDTQYETTTLELKNTSFFETGMATHDLTAGIKYANRDRNDNDAGGAPGGEGKRWSIYAVDEISIGDAWTVTPALRYEHNEITGTPPLNTGRFTKDAIMGGLSVRYAFGNGLAVFGSGAYTEVMPIIDDLELPQGVPPGTPRKRIRTSEKSTTYEIGASFDRQGVFRENDKLAVKLTYFDTELWDVTSATDISGGTGLLDEIDIHGLEIEASYAMLNGFYVDLNASITDADERTMAGVVQDYGNTPQDNLRLTVGKVFDDTYDLSWEAVFGDSITINGDPTAFASGESYDVHNLRLTVAPKGNGVWEDTEFRIGIENLFDEQYTPNLATRAQPGRNFKLTLAKTF